MLGNQFVAHIDGVSGRIQTCNEHCRNVAVAAENALCRLGLGKTAYLSGLLHDMGKYSNEFQEYIRKGDPSLRGTVVHSSAGASFVLRRFHSAERVNTFEQAISDMTAEIIAFAIGAHHGLFDATRPNDQTSGFETKITRQPETDRRAEEAFLSDFSGSFNPDILFREAENEIRSVDSCIKNLLVNKGSKAKEYRFYISMLQRLVCSALIDADRTDTAGFYGSNNPSCNPDWNDSVRRIESRVSTFPVFREIDAARKAFSDACSDAAGRKPGIYRLNLPTGGGKTLSSLRFAALQASHMGASRIVYVSPLLSIIEQNEAVFRDVLGDDMVLAHHSDLVTADKGDSAGDNKDDYSAADILRQNWNAPVIVTTLVRVLYLVRFGLYEVKGSVSVQSAQLTGFSDSDAEMLKHCLRTLFVNDESAARPAGSLEVVRVFWWEHNGNGQASPATVHRSVHVRLKDGIDRPVSADSYEISRDEIPGLTCEEMTGL